MAVAYASLAAASAVWAIAGCSDDDPAPAAPDASTSQRDGAVTAPTGAACAQKTAVTTVYNYRTAAVAPGACTEADLASLKTYVQANATATFGDVYAYARGNLGAGCLACVASDVNAAAWAPMLLQDGGFLAPNGSGCFEVVSRRGVVCATAHRNWELCILEACLECDPGQAFNECTQEVQTGAACGAQARRLAEECGDEETVNTWREQCRGEFGLDRWIEAQCIDGPAVADAGADG